MSATATIPAADHLIAKFVQMTDQRNAEVLANIRDLADQIRQRAAELSAHPEYSQAPHDIIRLAADLIDLQAEYSAAGIAVHRIESLIRMIPADV